MTVEIRRIDPGDDDALGAYVRVRNAVTPEDGDSLDDAHWADTTYPGAGARFLALDAGSEVGTASTGRIWIHQEDFDRWWLGIWVLPDARLRGTGSALYRAISDEARVAGKTGFETQLSETHADGLSFLAHRGFVEIDRAKMVRLELAGLPPPNVDLPGGIRLVTLAERPDLEAGVHEIAVETFPDIPSTDVPVDAGTLDAFVARDVHRPGILLDAFFVALDVAAGLAVGYASLTLVPGSTTVAYHDMTAVRRAWRGRGLAMQLKRATIAWAVEHGLEALETGNDESNAPMRAVNARLGYRPMPDQVGLQGPLAPAS